MQRLGNRYAVGGLLGEGGMGIVHEGVDEATGRRVAIKLLRAPEAGNAVMLERFHREAQATAQLRHPNIVELLDFVPGPPPAMVLELLQGESLRQRIGRAPRLQPVEIVAIVEQILAALGAAHAHGIVHRDVKPANVFLQGDRVKLLDFGVAKLLEASGPALTRSHHMVGSATYMAPEQIRGGQVDARTDLFAVALCLYELCTGARAYEGATPHEVMLRIAEGTPVPAHPALAPPLLEVIRRATSFEAAHRFSSAAELATAVRRALEGAAATIASGSLPPGGLPAPARPGPEDWSTSASHTPPPRQPFHAPYGAPPAGVAVSSVQTASTTAAPASSKAPWIFSVVLLVALVAVVASWATLHFAGGPTPVAATPDAAPSSSSVSAVGASTAPPGSAIASFDASAPRSSSVVPAERPIFGKECKNSKDCPGSQICSQEKMRCADCERIPTSSSTKLKFCPVDGDKRCANVLSNMENCGACGTVCTGMTKCIEGVCEPMLPEGATCDRKNNRCYKSMYCSEKTSRCACPLDGKWCPSKNQCLIDRPCPK